MAIQVQIRRGTSAENDAFTGAVGEITVDNTNKLIRVHDGSSIGGVALVNTTATQTLTNKTLSSPSITGATTATGNIAINNPTNTGITTTQATAYVFNETATTLRIGGAATTLSIGAAGTDTLTYQATAGSFIPGANNTVNLGSTTRYWGSLFAGQINANTITVSGNIEPSSNLSVTNNLGSDTLWWNNFYGVATQARYADLAENYQADSSYESGTVVSFGGECEVTISTMSHDIGVAGVVSSHPAHLMNSQLSGTNVIALALQGRVPCQVKGPVNKGSLIVSSNIPGVAQALDNKLYQPGCIIGKSLEIITDDSIRTIEVVVGRV